MHTPEPPPEAVLLRLARKAAGATVEETARSAGISKAWLSSIENGYDTRAEDGMRPVRAKDEVVARLADFLHITPERLETEGRRRDAALVLAEMHRQRQEARHEPAEASSEPRYADPTLQAIWEIPGLSAEVREAFISLALDMRRNNEASSEPA